MQAKEGERRDRAKGKDRTSEVGIGKLVLIL